MLLLKYDIKHPYGITKDIYNKKCISKNAKIRHYSTVAVSYTHLDVYKRQLEHSARGTLKSGTAWVVYA